MSMAAFRAFARAAAGAAAALGLLAAFGCDAGTPGAEDRTPAASVGSRTITVAELDAHIKESLFRQASEDRDPGKLYELRSQAVEEMIDEQLLEAEAKKRGMSRDDLVKVEATKAKPVEQAEVQAFYDRLKPRLGETKLEAVADQIRERLETQRIQEAHQALVQGLREQAKVEVKLEPPRIDVAAEGPSRGPADAPVTIVEFSDYQCPFCKRAEPTVQEVVKRYPQQVRVVFRHFPLDSIHPLARPAAEAAACAEEQGKFWEYHALLFDKSPELDPATLKKLAGDSKLDVAAFDACVASGKHKQRVEKDAEAGRAANVSGTPAFFVNGIPLSGARSLDDFVKLIEKELAKPKAAS
jgi:protein-disulfide isomerase